MTTVILGYLFCVNSFLEITSFKNVEDSLKNFKNSVKVNIIFYI
jgi:hypothetical protein